MAILAARAMRAIRTIGAIVTIRAGKTIRAVRRKHALCAALTTLTTMRSRVLDRLRRGYLLAQLAQYALKFTLFQGSGNRGIESRNFCH